MKKIVCKCGKDWTDYIKRDSMSMSPARVVYVKCDCGEPVSLHSAETNDTPILRGI